MRNNRLFDFSNKMRLLRVLLSHAQMMLAVLILICFIIDRVNTAMEFISSPISKWMIALLAAVSLISALLNILALWDNPDRRRRRK